MTLFGETVLCKTIVSALQVFEFVKNFYHMKVKNGVVMAFLQGILISFAGAKSAFIPVFVDYIICGFR